MIGALGLIAVAILLVACSWTIARRRPEWSVLASFLLLAAVPTVWFGLVGLHIEAWRWWSGECVWTVQHEEDDGWHTYSILMDRGCHTFPHGVSFRGD